MKITCNDSLFPNDASEIPIVIYPDPVLKTVADSVTEFDENLKTLTDNMLKTMYHAPGIGLAGPQVGVLKRIFVMDVDYNRESKDESDSEFYISDLNPQVFINPEIVESDGDTEYEEGCLSLPGIFHKVSRKKEVKIRYQDVTGATHEIAADDLASICIQHEKDHLDGIVFIDHLSQLKYQFYRQKMVKEKKRLQNLEKES